MSLVNDMLKDLEQRQQNPWPEAQPQDPLGEAQGSKWLRYSALTSVLLLVAGAGWWIASPLTEAPPNQPTEPSLLAGTELPLTEQSHPIAEATLQSQAPVEPSREPVLQPQIQQTQGAASPEGQLSPLYLEKAGDAEKTLADEQAGEQAKVITGQAESVTVITPQLTSEQRIHRLLTKAEQAKREDRLTVPFNDNAYNRYQTVLLLAPGHPQALAGMTDVAHRYVELAEQNQANGNARQARHLYQLGVQVAGQVNGLVLPPLSPSPRPASVVAATEMQPRETISGTAVAANEKQDAPVKDQPDADSGHFQLTTSSVVRDQRIAREAKQLLSDGRGAAAQQLLLDYLAENPDARNSRDELFSVYLTLGDYQAARQQLAQMDFLEPAQQRWREARLLVRQNQLTKAAELLTTDPPPIAEAVEYHNLLAGIYQKQGQFAEAAALYRRLLVVDRRQATFWLGLAIALDGQGDREALNAFRQAQRYGAGGAQTQDYIAQRIAALTH